MNYEMKIHMVRIFIDSFLFCGFSFVRTHTHYTHQTQSQGEIDEPSSEFEIRANL
jgi:hypothetical protein